METWRKKREAMKTRWKKQRKREAILPSPVLSPYSDRQNCRHSLYHSDSPFPSTNSAILPIFLKIKNPNHWVFFPSAQPHPYTAGKNPTWCFKWLEVKPQSQPTRLKGKKIKNFHCPCIHSCNQRMSFNFSTD